MNSNINQSINNNNKQMNPDDINSLSENSEKRKESLDVDINDKKTDYTQNQNPDTQNSYSLIPVNQENSELSLKKHSSKKRKKIIPKKYFQNTFKRKSIIGLCLNLFFWIWSIVYILNYKKIIELPRGSLYNKKVLMVYSYNTDSMIGNFFSTLIYTFFNYFILYIYPEVILLASYCAYVIYSLFNTEKDKFKEDIFLLSKNTYVILVILSFGELYKLFARKYLDI